MDDAPAREPVPEDTARLARTLDWNLLRTFVVIVDEGGITAAARRLLLRQPSVTKRPEAAGGPARPPG